MDEDIPKFNFGYPLFYININLRVKSSFIKDIYKIIVKSA
jgi:hypothetical protein